tara:strand:- start:108 stop:1250 length:1143 start_codon:yes stop_codon:yes gene_type:complete
MDDIIRVGVTGNSGFLGKHLHNYLNLQKDISLVFYAKSFFLNPSSLSSFVDQCDCIIHLAGLNRHDDQNILYKTNVDLVKKLIDACELSRRKKHIIFSSSIQIKNESMYSKSKLEGARLFKDWAERSGNSFTNLIIPNIYGPFGKPFYNSFISTFCYQLINEKPPVIDEDRKVKLIYVGSVVEKIYNIIKNDEKFEKKIFNYKDIEIEYDKKKYVSEVLSMLKKFDNQYKKRDLIPNLSSNFKLSLFNTYRSYLPTEYFPKKHIQNIDYRGKFVELVRSDNLGQFSYSITKPGILRGQHFHTKKVERFIVIGGTAIIRLRKVGSDEIIEYHLDGNNPSYVDIPIWHTHNIENVGTDSLITLFWVNEHFDNDNPDTFFEEV